MLTDLETVIQKGPSHPLLSDSLKETVISHFSSYLRICGLVRYEEATSLIPGRDRMLPQTGSAPPGSLLSLQTTACLYHFY